MIRVLGVCPQCGTIANLDSDATDNSSGHLCPVYILSRVHASGTISVTKITKGQVARERSHRDLQKQSRESRRKRRRDW